MRYFIAIALALVYAVPSAAQARRGSGLETGSSRRVPVLVERLRTLRDRPPVTEAEIYGWVTERLSAHGLEPVNAERDNSDDWHLYVRVTINEPLGFNVGLSLDRNVVYVIDGVRYSDTAATWDDGVLVTGSTDRSGIRRVVMNEVVDFIQLYKVANGL